MKHRNLLSILNLEELHEALGEDIDKQISEPPQEELSEENEDEEMLALAAESRQLSELIALRETLDVSLSTEGGHVKVAAMLATALEAYEIEIPISMEDPSTFVTLAQEGLNEAIKRRLQAVKNRLQNFANYFKSDKKLLAATEHNGKVIADAISNQPKTVVMTGGIATNIAIGSQFSDATIGELEKSVKVMQQLLAYVEGEIKTVRTITKLENSRTALSASDIVTLLKGHLVPEKLPVIQTAVLPGNRIITNIKGVLPHFKRISGDGMEWIASASESKMLYDRSTLRGVRAKTGPLTLSAAAQKRLPALNESCKNLQVNASDVWDRLHEATASLGDGTNFNEDGTMERNAYNFENGLLYNYTMSLANISLAVYYISRKLSLGLRQLITSK